MSEQAPQDPAEGSGHSGAPRSHRQTRSRRSRIWRRIGVGLLVLVVIVVGGGFVAYKHLDGNINGVDVSTVLGKDRPKKVKVKGPSQPINVLVMGSDTRDGANGKDIGGDTPGLSDTTILLHIAADRQSAYGVSLPRDAIVQRPECPRKNGKGTDPGGLTQFNAAYAVGGPACTVKTVEKLTDIRIDHFVVIDFVGFKKMVDAIHGVQVCVPTAVDDTVGHIQLPAGTYNVTGEQALDYVRVRHDLGAETGDIGRMKRQQTFIAAMIKKVVSAGTLTNPVRLYNFLNAATSSLTTDEEFSSLRQLASLGTSLKNIGLDNIKFITVPFEPYPEDTNRVEWAPNASKLWRQIRLDRAVGPNLDTDVVSVQQPSNGSSSSPSTSPSSSPSASSSGSASASPSPSAGSSEDAEERSQSARANGLCT